LGLPLSQNFLLQIPLASATRRRAAMLVARRESVICAIAAELLEHREINIETVRKLFAAQSPLAHLSVTVAGALRLTSV
jgi:hypothetical protein